MDINEIIGYEDSFKVTEQGISHIGHSVILKRQVERLGLTDEEVMEAAVNESKAFLDVFYPNCGESHISYKGKDTYYKNHNMTAEQIGQLKPIP